MNILFMGFNGSGKEHGLKILKGLKIVLKHFVLDFDDPVKDKEPNFQSKE